MTRMSIIDRPYIRIYLRGLGGFLRITQCRIKFAHKILSLPAVESAAMIAYKNNTFGYDFGEFWAMVKLCPYTSKLRPRDCSKRCFKNGLFPYSTLSTLSHRKYLLVILRRSTPPQTRQLILYHTK